MDAGFDFSFQGNVLAFVQGRGRTVAFDRYLKSRDKVRAGHLLSPYLSSHDTPGALFQLQGDKQLFRLAAALELTVSGLPMIYYGEEVGRPGGDWPDNRSDMPWGNRKIEPGAGKPRDEVMRAWYKKLIAVRRAHPALSHGIYESVSSDGDLLVFRRRDEAAKDTVLVAVNRGAQAATVAFDPPAEWEGRAAYDEISGERPARKDARFAGTVEPRGVAVFAAEPWH
jgi:alpha-amylase